MVELSVGDIVFVNFPFSNLKNSKLRPAVIIADVFNEDWILCQITSKSYADLNSIKLKDSNFDSGSLNIISYIRPGKIFTAHKSIINKQVGKLNIATRQLVINNIVNLISIIGSPK